MCYPHRPALRLSPVAAQSLYASSHGDAYRWTTLSEELHPASLPTQDAFLGYRWSYSGSAIVRTCSRDWTMMKRTRAALATDKPRASCRTIGVRLPQNISVTSCPLSRGPAHNHPRISLCHEIGKFLANSDHDCDGGENRAVTGWPNPQLSSSEAGNGGV